MINLDTICIAVEKIILEASKFFFDKELYKNLYTKAGDSNYATEVDYIVQQHIVEELPRVIPNSNIITEESNKNNYQLNKPTWILDPVDGTTNLMHQFKHSAFSIALIMDQKPSLGMIYNPYLKEMFAAIAGRGAYLNKERIHVSKTSSLSDSLIGFGTTPYKREKAEETFRIVKEVFMKSQEVRRSGSGALDIAYVACGRLDGFFELELQPWDYAAGSIILGEAGGKICNWSGEGFKMVRPESIIASNTLIHEELIEIIGLNKHA